MNFQQVLFGIAAMLIVLVLCWAALPHTHPGRDGPLLERRSTILALAAVCAITCVFGVLVIIIPDN